MDYGARGTVNARDNLSVYEQWKRDDRARRDALAEAKRRLETDLPRVTPAERREALDLARDLPRDGGAPGGPVTLGFEV